MSTVRVIARIRPLLPHEREMDIIVQGSDTKVTIPNPRNEGETFTFNFNAVHGMDCDQAELFTEVSPALKHAFKGNDVTIFAYGVTGTGKTHTMRGGKKAAERGIIPRLLHAIFRRKKELEKKSESVSVSVTMSYYEIYNDKVYDLFQAPEKRNAAGLPLRECDKKTIVVGLSENAVGSPAEFEKLYDMANNNRSTSATKLNAHSSRSHAITCIKVVIEDSATGDIKEGKISAIDLAGSEDNRRTANDKERMLESQAINRSLFVLAQCVDAIAKKQPRIPYRDSKMTRILGLGQGNSMTIMFLNLAPTRSYHQDTLSSLNVASRAKTIETKEVETETFRQPTKAAAPVPFSQRQPLRPKGAAKPSSVATARTANATITKKPLAPKPKALTTSNISRPATTAPTSAKEISKLEAELRELKAAQKAEIEQIKATLAAQMSENKASEKKLMEKMAEAEKQREARMYCHLAKQDRHRGDFAAAIENYRLALLYVPDHPKILSRIENLEALIASGESKVQRRESSAPPAPVTPKAPKKKVQKLQIFKDASSPAAPPRPLSNSAIEHTPRTAHLLETLNTHSLPLITSLKGIGTKKAERLLDFLAENENPVRSLDEVAAVPGIGWKTVEGMRSGVVFAGMDKAKGLGLGVCGGKENVEFLPRGGGGGAAAMGKLDEIAEEVEVRPAAAKRRRAEGFTGKWCFDRSGGGADGEEESEYEYVEEADESFEDGGYVEAKKRKRAGVGPGRAARMISVR